METLSEATLGEFLEKGHGEAHMLKLVFGLLGQCQQICWHKKRVHKWSFKKKSAKKTVGLLFYFIIFIFILFYFFPFFFYFFYWGSEYNIIISLYYFSCNVNFRVIAFCLRNTIFRSCSFLSRKLDEADE